MYLLYLKGMARILGIDYVCHVLLHCRSTSLTVRILRAFGATVGGRNVRIGPYLQLHNVDSDFSNLVVGEDVYIGPHVTLDLASRITFRNHTAVGMWSEIFTHASYVGTYSVLFPWKSGPVVFEEHSGCNPGVIVLGPLTIGRNTYVTPGSVLTGDAPPYSVMRGNPAAVLMKLPERVLRSYEEPYRRERLKWEE
jgi:acetyltransferase-like isoleucine patch superfamily enzyme